MSSRESALFPGTALPAGVLALVLTAWLAWTHADDLAGRSFSVLAVLACAVLSYALSFSASGRGRASLEIAYFIAAAVALPFPAAILVGAGASFVGSAFRPARAQGWLRALTVAAANVTIGVAMTGTATMVTATFVPTLPAAAGIDRAASAGFPALLAACAALFVVMSLVNLCLMASWSALRGDSPGEYARRFVLTILPVETLNIPLGCLLAVPLSDPSSGALFTLTAILGFFASLLLRRLGDSEESLRVANHQLEDRIVELATLTAIGREISSSLDPRRVFETVRRECRKVFRPDFFWIARLDPHTLEVTADYSMAGNLPARTMTLRLGRGIASHVIETGAPLLVSDAARDPLLHSLDPIVLEPRIRSILAVPLVVEKRTIGVLSVQSYREDAYDHHHVSLLGTIGQQAAVALENARHYELATTDQLTTLCQRDVFLRRLAEEGRRSTRYGTPFCLLMLDLDGFKAINDQFGHLAGDRYLRAVGLLIRSVLRATDVPARYGGEEFCLLLPETDLGGAKAIAERLRGDIGALRVREGPHALGTTVSIGVSSYPLHFEGSLESVLRKADQSLLEAKALGKDRIVVANEIRS